MRTRTLLIGMAALLGSTFAASAGTDMVSGHDYDLPSRPWQPPPPPDEGTVWAPPPPVYYAPPPPVAYYPPPYAYGPGPYGPYGYYGPGFYGPAIGIRFHGRF
jgi:hypothetical protein